MIQSNWSGWLHHACNRDIGRQTCGRNAAVYGAMSRKRMHSRIKMGVYVPVVAHNQRQHDYHERECHQGPCGLRKHPLTLVAGTGFEPV